MKSIKRIILIIILVQIFLPLSAMAEEFWVCPNCNRKNTTSFCPDCGAKRPENKQNENNTQLLLQNGLEFGDSREIVKSKDIGAKTDSTNKSILISNGSLFGIPNFEIKYFFSGTDELTGILYVLHEKDMRKEGYIIEGQIRSGITEIYGTALPLSSWNDYDGFPWMAYEYAMNKIGKKGGAMGDSRWTIEKENRTILIDIITYFPNVKDNGYKDRTICLGLRELR